MKNTLETRLGVFVAMTIIAAVVIVETIGGTAIFQRSYRLYALFDSIHDLKLDDRVKLAGYEIGRVDNIELENNKVKVTLKLHADAVVKTDSTASIKFSGLMGQNYVAIDFGTPEGERATDGTYLNTEEQPDIGVIMQKLDNLATDFENLAQSFPGDEIAKFLGPLTDFVKQNSGQLSATIANFRTMTDQMTNGVGTVGKLIYDDSLYNTTLAAVTDLQTTIADARNVVTEIHSGQGSLGKMLNDETLYRETTASMTNLREILEKINQGQGTVGKLVNEPDFYKNAKLTLQKMDKMTESLEDTGPLTVVGTAVGNLF